jgi:hypothetical protein
MPDMQVDGVEGVDHVNHELEFPESVSPQTLYANLSLLEGADVDVAALVRQLAQAILANPNISLYWREAIADRLHQFNRELQMRSLEDCDSY